LSRALHRREAGFTIVETVIAMAVMSIGLVAALALLDRGTLQSEAASSLFLAEDRARGALAGCFDVLTETSVEHVDTCMRVHSASVLGNDVMSDRFSITGVTLRQCGSPTCSFHTRPDLTVWDSRFDCGFEYCTGLLGAPVTRGKNVPPVLQTCPFDGSALVSPARLDGVKVFVARDSTGAFSALADGTPRWTGLVIFMPAASNDGLTELRRYDVYVSDLVAAPPVYSAGFSRFDPLNPSMVELFDFGTDGTTDGTPDGSVPLTNALSDAKTESFTTASYQGDPVILITKSLATSILGITTYPSRSLTLRINLATGETYFSVDHHDQASTYWTATRTFTRQPRTLVRGLTEFAVSTAVSNPFHAVNNPSGVSEANVVRVTVGTSDAPRSETAQWLHHVETFQIKARN
jgi:hypothetical protein